jgi:3-deoxy-D-manno-octulosonic-acid transferase
MLILYDILTTAALILSAPLFLLLKKRSSLKVRLGFTLPKLGDATAGRLWIHALSVGEVLSTIPLLAALRSRYPSREIVLTVKTATGLALAAERLENRVDYLLPMPFDFWWSVRRIINTVRPDLFILVETDIWPGLISSLKKKGVKTILVNGRISPRTGAAYKRWRFLFGRVLGLFELLLMQTDQDKSRILKGGVSRDKVAVTGNIKFDRKSTLLTREERDRWRELLGLKNGLTWVAGSTHHPEEKIIFTVFGHLLKSFPDLSLLICPREAHRFNEVYRLAQELGLRAVRKTELPLPDRTHDVVVIDTIGELDKVYGLGDVAFVGGSLAPKGGHNLLEPASFGVPVIFGPHTFNFDAMSRSMIDCGGGKRVHDESELLHMMEGLLGRVNERVSIGNRAQEFVEQNQGALERVMAILEPYVECS